MSNTQQGTPKDLYKVSSTFEGEILSFGLSGVHYMYSREDLPVGSHHPSTFKL